MKKTIILIIATLLTIGCKSVDFEKQSFQDLNGLSTQDWLIGFEYEHSDSDDIEQKEVLNTHIKALDDIYYNLLESGVNISKATTTEKSNLIGLSFVYGNRSKFDNASINIYDSEGQIITRIKISNQYKGGYDTPIKNDDFTRYCSDLIFAELQ